MKKISYSILREQEFLELSKLELNGEILDLGSSQNAGYHKFIKGNYNITTVNIDFQCNCDLVFDIQNKFPLNDCSFDYCLLFNVLEHVYRFENVLEEVFRVLKKNGQIIIAVPFMFYIHKSPDDFFRYSESALINLLKDNGFEIIKLKKLGFGLFSLFFQIINGKVPGFLRLIIKELCIFFDNFLSRVFKKYRNLNEKIPLGYFVVARK